MMWRHAPLIPLLIGLAACSSQTTARHEPAKSAPPPPIETSFEGHFFAGADEYLPSGDRISVLLFLDPTGKPDGKSATDQLLEGVAANSDSLQASLMLWTATNPGGFASTAAVKGKPVKGMTFIIACPLEGLQLPPQTKVKGEIKRAKPGNLTRLAQVKEARGPERELQAWKGEFLQPFLMEGVVYWWGDVGIKAAADGSITHVLLRGQPKPVAGQ